MNCDELRDRLSAAVDGELSAAESAEIERHLASCATCRDVMSSLQSLDVQLRRETATVRDRAPDIAAAALARLPPQFDRCSGQPNGRSALGERIDIVSGHLSRPSAAASGRTFLIAVAAMACGFLLAFWLFRPTREIAPPTVANDVRVAAPVTPPTVPTRIAPAVIRVATGPIEFASAPAGWTTVPEPAGFACEPGVVVRTPDSTVCELETSAGATVRMNVATELCVVDAGDIQISHGEIWCRTPDASGLKVTPTVMDTKATAPVSLVCGPNGPASCVFTCPVEEATARVAVASGRVEVVSPQNSEPVDAGRCVEWRDGALKPASRNGVLAERWMHPLLVRKGPADRELAARVNALLAEVGRTKVSYLCERDLRSLGEYGALPLLRFVQAESSSGDLDRRRTAAAILADVAPAWMTSEFIKLLADGDPLIRVSAAAGLKRLTGETLGMTVEAWGETGRDLGPAIAQWQAWWQAERQAYPSPPAGVAL
ncbi:MAG: zf-HC2 domain-containing protein [Planctomycetaceae bacterium]